MKASELRASILQEAISGRLIPQDPSEGTTEELLIEIAKERDALIKAGKIKKEKPLPEITEDEIPFEIPKTWKWVRLGDLGDYKKGPFGSSLTKSIFVKKSENTIKVYEQKNAIQKNEKLGTYYITEEYFESKMVGFEALPGDIIVSCAGTIGETFILPIGSERGIINQALMRIRLTKVINVDYYLLCFDSLLKTAAQSKSNGSAIKNIPPFEILKKLLIPIPPHAEQKRIVAKIEELTRLINAYGKEEEKLSTISSKFPEDIRKSILQEAVSGRLVPQDSSEGTVEELLKEIAKEREALVKAGKIKREKALPEIAEDEIPFEIPKTWKWVRLKSIVYNHGQKVPNKKFSYIDIGSINNLENRLNETENIIEAEDAPSRARKIVVKGDIIYATVRPYLHNACIIDRDFMEEPIVSTGFAVLSCNTGIFNKYLIFYLLSPDFDNYANSNENSKGIAYPAINDEKLYKAVIPLPPLKEQKRIVSKVEELMKIVEKIQQTI